MFKHGGSAQLVPKRKTRVSKRASRKESAKGRLLGKLSAERVKEIQDQWARMDTSFGGVDYELGNGIIVNLLQTNFSHVEICVLLKVGGGRVHGLKKVKSARGEG